MQSDMVSSLSLVRDNRRVTPHQCPTIIWLAQVDKKKKEKKRKKKERSLDSIHCNRESLRAQGEALNQLSAGDRVTRRRWPRVGVAERLTRLEFRRSVGAPLFAGSTDVLPLAWIHGIGLFVFRVVRAGPMSACALVPLGAGAVRLAGLGSSNMQQSPAF